MDKNEEAGISWRRLEYVGVTAFATIMGCVFIGQTAEHFADTMTITPAQTQLAAVKPTFNAIDYATTGALKSGTVVIGPCDTKTP